MQFVTNGPNVPDCLIQAHEDDRVVFFCGAGISYPAGLPGFMDLVTKLYDRLGKTPSSIQKSAIERDQHDTAISLLESDVVGGRTSARQHLAEILKPDLTSPLATATHEALLTLAKGSDGKRRLVTTNFDRIFEYLLTKLSLKLPTYAAPLLPIPKRRWDGLVYLHGLLPETPDAAALDQLVVSSGDFGLAYLTERWASRFVTELFRSYTVCFVGYSITDPVLRYMTDALAADQMLGESPTEVFAFGSYKKHHFDEAANEWRAKNVTPILYAEEPDHSYLHETLKKWAGIYRDGISGKQGIIVRYAAAKPPGVAHDDFVGRVLWALLDKSGAAARTFANHDPLPPIEWLEPLTQTRFTHGDLTRFGVQPNIEEDKKLVFSLMERPAPYTHSPWMTLVHPSHALAGAGDLDEVMLQLAHWLVRHLHDPALIAWVLKHDACPHPTLLRFIDDRLAVGDLPPALATIWRLFVTGRVANRGHQFDGWHWRNRFEWDGLTPSMRQKLLEILAPRVRLREPFRDRIETEEEVATETLRIRDVVGWEITLAAGDHIQFALQDLEKDEKWASALPKLLPDLTRLLRDVLDLMCELGEADEFSDGSCWHQPSISQHPQNQHFRKWTLLIELCRDAWLATAVQNADRARLEVRCWLTIPYPLFRRLAFFGATYPDMFTPDEALALLLSEECWWLWSLETERETIRLLVSVVPHLGASALGELLQAIITGPPRKMFSDDIDPEKLQQIIDRKIWLRLAKCQHVGAILSEVAVNELKRLSEAYPAWQIASDERDEFSMWIGSSEEWRERLATPKKCKELIDWLRTHPESDIWRDDDWRERCQQDFRRAAVALIHLARVNDEWIVARWREALQAWAEEPLAARSWCWIADLLATAPDEALTGMGHALSWWLQSVAKGFDGNEPAFFKLICWVINHHEREVIESSDDPVVFKAINHPVGQVTQAALQWWFRQELRDGQGLPAELKPILTRLADTKISSFRHGRVLLGAHIIALFRVDEQWTTQHAVPLFDWQLSRDEAQAAWEGFLWSPQLYSPLLRVLKQSFLSTAAHYAELGKHRSQYASLLAFVSLEPGDIFSITELKEATESLPLEGLETTANTLVHALSGADEKRADYWRNRVKPYFNSIWPNSPQNRSPAISASFAKLCTMAGDAFPDALKLLITWLQPIEQGSARLVIDQLNKSHHCQRFPRQALDFLDAVISDEAKWISRELGICLETIQTADSALTDLAKFRKLTNYVRRYG